MRPPQCIRSIALLLILGLSVAAQQPAANQTNSSQSSTAQPARTDQDTELAQMRQTLDRMESLNTNMSAEIEFLHDQNLQILLRSNSQMWTLLIRDLRRQLDREERRSGSR